MKKKLLFMMSAMLLMMASTVMTACSSDDDGPNTPEAPTEEGTRNNDGKVIPVLGDKSNFEALYDFFDKELPLLSISEQNNPFLLDGHSEICYFVNSYDEFRSIYTGKEQLPVIDFDSYTLIVGQTCSNNIYGEIDKQEFYEKDGKYNLDLFFYCDFVQPMIVYYNYWGLYPKLSKEELNVNLNVVMDSK